MKKTIQVLDLQIPANLKNLQTILTEAGFGHLTTIHHLDKVHHFIDLIFNRWWRVAGLSRHDFVPTSSEVMADIYGSHFYCEIKKALLKANIIESSNDHYTNDWFWTHPGVSKAYRLTEQYRNSEAIEVTANYDHLIEKVLKWKERNQTVMDVKNKRTYQKLKNTIIHDLSIDVDAAIKYCLEKYPYTKYKKGTTIERAIKVANSLIGTDREISVFKDELKKYKARAKRKVKNQRGELAQVEEVELELYSHESLTYDLRFIYQIKKLQEGDTSDLIFTNDNAAKRLFTTFCLGSRDIRQFIRLKGKPLCGPDIANSQPLMLGLLIIKERGGREKLKPDEELYLQHCLDGIFYDRIMDHFDIPQSGRTDFKASFFGKTLFCKNLHMDKEFTGYMEIHYPNVLAEIKKRKHKNYKSLAIELQTIEREFIIDIVTNSVLRQRPGTPILTLHDCLYTTEEHLQFVNDELKKYFNMKYKIKPKVKIEDYRNKTERNLPQLLFISKGCIQILLYPDGKLKAATHDLGELVITDVTHLKDQPERLKNLDLGEFLSIVNGEK